MGAVGYRRRAGRLLATSVCFATIAGALTACGDIQESSSSAPAIASASSDTPKALVPSSVRSTGTLVIGTNIPFPPMEYFKSDNQTYTGADIDLIEAIAHGLGLKPKLVNMGFNGLIPALVSGRLDAIISGMGDFTDREKQVAFVDYLTTDPEVVVPKADASQFTSLLSLCGKSIAVQTGSVQVTTAQLLSKRCQGAGKPPLRTMQFDEDSQALLAQESGRVQLHATDGPIAEYEAATIDGGKRFVAKFPNFLSTRIAYGIAVQKDDMGLARAIKAELNVLITNGTYARILRRYHLQRLAVRSALINGATVSSTDIK